MSETRIKHSVMGIKFIVSDVTDTQAMLQAPSGEALVVSTEKFPFLDPGDGVLVTIAITSIKEEKPLIELPAKPKFIIPGGLN